MICEKLFKSELSDDKAEVLNNAVRIALTVNSDDMMVGWDLTSLVAVITVAIVLVVDSLRAVRVDNP